MNQVKNNQFFYWIEKKNKWAKKKKKKEEKVSTRSLIIYTSPKLFINFILTFHNHE